jgi:hypothetical protein
MENQSKMYEALEGKDGMLQDMVIKMVNGWQPTKGTLKSLVLHPYLSIGLVRYEAMRVKE